MSSNYGYGYAIYHFVIEVVHGESEIEPNDTRQQADTLPSADLFEAFSLNASIGYQGDDVDIVDWYQVHLPLGQLVKAKCSQGIVMRVYDSQMAEVPEFVGTVEDMLGVTFLARKERTYHILVVPIDTGIAADYTLALESALLKPYDEIEYARIPQQKLELPVFGFTGQIGHYGQYAQGDTSDTFRFFALAGSTLKLKFTEGYAGFINIRQEDPSEYGGYYLQYPVDTGAGEYEWLITRPGAFELQLYAAVTKAVDYTFNLELVTDKLVIRSVSPRDIKLNKPTTFIADVLGSESASFQWSFGGSATPSESTQRYPTVVCSVPGVHSGSLTVKTSGPPTTFAFSFNVSDWERETVKPINWGLRSRRPNRRPIRSAVHRYSVW